MARVLPELMIAPLLVGGATLSGRRWGPRIAGLVSAFPAVVGPVLLICVQERGTAFAARVADGTLLGLVALSGFVLVYARVALRAGWGLSLAAGWACAATMAILVGWSAHGLLLGVAVAVVSLMLALAAMPRAGRDASAAAATADPVWIRMALTAALVGVLAVVAAATGPTVGGMLAALPVLASVLAVLTHRRHGPEVLVALLRGMLMGMAGFVAFCAVVAGLVVPAGTGLAFGMAVLAAVGAQMLAARRLPA